MSRRGAQPSTRETILAAVDALVRSKGWAKTTMGDIAREAQVSRQTLYNELGSRQALIEAYVAQEINSLVLGVEDVVRSRADDPRAALSGAFEHFLQLASDEALIQVITNDAEGGELVRLVTSIGEAVAVSRIGSLVVEVWPQVRPADARLLAATLARLAVSHAMLSTSGRRQTAADVTRVLGPYVDEILG